MCYINSNNKGVVNTDTSVVSINNREGALRVMWKLITDSYPQ